MKNYDFNAFIEKVRKLKNQKNAKINKFKIFKNFEFLEKNEKNGNFKKTGFFEKTVIKQKEG